MIERIYDANVIAPVIKKFLLEDYEAIDPIEWISNPINILLQNEHGDLAIFEQTVVPGIYNGHYFFNSRGGAVIKAAPEFLDNLFNTEYNINVLTGYAPLTRRDSRWMCRRIGFKSYGVQYIGDKPYEMFIMTKKEFNER